MKPWLWILLFAAAAIGHFFMPPSWLVVVPWLAMFVMAAHLGGRIDDCMYRISRLEADAAAHDQMIAKHDAQILIDIPDRIYDVEKRLRDYGI